MELRDRQLLFSLEAELPSLRASLVLARSIGEFPTKEACKHPVLQFVFPRATTAVIENSLLRFAEAIDPLLERASTTHLGRSLFNGKKGRERKAVSPVFQLALELRSEAVAHRIMMDGKDGRSYAAVVAAYGSIWTFLDAAVEEIAALLAELRECGLFEAPGLSSVRVRHTRPFSLSDLSELIDVANALIDRSDEDVGSP